MFTKLRSYIVSFFSKPLVQAGAKAAASAYAGPAGAKAVEIIGPKVLEVIEPDQK